MWLIALRLSPPRKAYILPWEEKDLHKASDVHTLTVVAPLHCNRSCPALRASFMQADSDHAQSEAQAGFFLKTALKGELTQAHGSSWSSAFATAKDALIVLQLLSLEAPSPTQPTSGWRFRRILQELDRLALKQLSAYYVQPFALPSALEARGPLSFCRQSRRIAKAVAALGRHIAVVEGHPRVARIQVRPHLQLARTDSDLVCDLFVAIAHERRIAVGIPLLCHVRHTRTAGPPGFVPVLSVLYNSEGLVNLLASLGQVFAQRGSLHFKRPGLARYDSPFLPQNGEATGTGWSGRLLIFKAASWKSSVKIARTDQDVAEAARLVQA